ncbi:MAG: hypothetical protein SPJ69_08705 [Campylobacter sp.]|nr:hypothetical protein [Campylobacter sp.]MDD7600513.1 hypothetical protein [Campylobacteraceae bacterium]MDY5888380.1 hypothetical protein [Campylobacter sp.]
MRKSHQPIRMCVVCRMRLFQHKLARFASIDGKIIKNPKNCRSCYL